MIKRCLLVHVRLVTIPSVTFSVPIQFNVLNYFVRHYVLAGVPREWVKSEREYTLGTQLPWSVHTVLRFVCHWAAILTSSFSELGGSRSLKRSQKPSLEWVGVEHTLNLPRAYHPPSSLLNFLLSKDSTRWCSKPGVPVFKYPEAVSEITVSGHEIVTRCIFDVFWNMRVYFVAICILLRGHFALSSGLLQLLLLSVIAWDIRPRHVPLLEFSKEKKFSARRKKIGRSNGEGKAI